MKTLKSKHSVLFHSAVLLMFLFIVNVSTAHAQLDPQKFICREHIDSAFRTLTYGGMPKWLHAVFDESTGDFIGYVIHVTSESAPLLRNALNMAYNNVYADPLYLGEEYNSVEKMNELVSSWTDQPPDSFDMHWLFVSDFRYCDDDDFWNSGKTIYDVFASKEPFELLPVAASVVLVALLAALYGLNTWRRGFRGLSR